ncbi:MAG: hypothetical protein RJA05_2047 [Planctomycetota bacterium]|jgi:hypothetical protein
MKTTLILCSILGASMLTACGGGSSSTAIREDQKRKPPAAQVQAPDDAFNANRKLQSSSGAAGVEPPKKN